MTDLNKERELYESVIEKTQGIKMEHLIGISFNAEANQYEISGEKWACELTDACEELNTGWFIWQECVKAKAQAVPVWISADFMKPDEGNLVLGISTTKLAKFNVYQVVALDEFDECEINYWMPLPTAPSESGAEQ